MDNHNSHPLPSRFMTDCGGVVWSSL